MKRLISLIALIIALVFVGCGGVDSESSGGSATLIKVESETSVGYDELGRVTNDGNTTYTYDKNGNLVAISK